MYSKIAFGSAVLACALSAATATFVFPALTIAAGGSSALVLTGTQVAFATAALASLAIAKEALILGSIADRGRGRRDANEITEMPVEFKEMFESIAKNDVADCGKLLVCHAMAKSDETLTSEEKLIVKLFPNQPFEQNGYGEYQWAAYAGSFKHPQICTERYARCPVAAEQLGDLFKVNL